MPFDVGAVRGSIQLDVDPAKKALGQFNREVEASTRAAGPAARGYLNMSTGAKGLTAQLGKASAFIQQHAENIRRVGMAISVAGAAIAAGLGKAVMAAADFETQMRNVDSIMKLSEGRFESMSAEVVALSTRLPQTAATLASGLYDIASSGFTGSDALRVLEASAKAASAGISDTATAARAIAGALNAYGMSAADAGHISDVLFKTVDRGVITFSELSNGIGEVLASAAAVGVSLEEAGAAIATMTKAGINADMTMTALNRIMVTFLDPPKELTAVLAKVTNETALQIIQTKGLAGAVEILNRVSGNSPDLLAAMGLEQRALRAAMSLTREEGAIYRAELEKQAKAAGATQAALERQGKAFAYQWGLMKNQITAAAISIGQELIPALRPLVDTLGEAAKGVAAWVKENPELTRSLIVAAAAIGGLMLAVGPLVIALPGLVSSLRLLLPLLAPQLVFAFQAVAGGAATAGEAIAFLAAPAGAVALATAAFSAMTFGIYEAIKAYREWLAFSKQGPGAELTERTQLRVDIRKARAKLAEAQARAAPFTESGKAVPALIQADLRGWAYQVSTLTFHYEKLTAAEKAAAVAATPKKVSPPGGGGSGGGAGGGTGRAVAETADAMLAASTKALEWLRLQAEIAKVAGDAAAQHAAEAAQIGALERVWERWRTSQDPARAELALSSKKAADALREEQRKAADASLTYEQLSEVLNDISANGWDPMAEALRELHPEWAQAEEEVGSLVGMLNEFDDALAAGGSNLQEYVYGQQEGVGAAVELRKELALLDEQIAATGQGYAEKLATLSALMKESAEDTEALLQLQAARRQTLNEWLERDLSLLEDSRLTMAEQRDLLDEIIRKWEGLGIFVLPGMEQKLRELKDQLDMLTFGLRGFLLTYASDLKSSFADLFSGLMDGTARFRDFMASVLGMIRDYLAKIIAQWVFEKTLGKLLGMGTGDAAEAAKANVKAGAAMAVAGGLNVLAGKAMQSAAKNMLSAASMMAAGSFGGGGGGNWLSKAAGIVGAVLPFLDEGGVVTRPTLAVIGEKGPEAVIPLSHPAAVGALSGGQSPIIINQQLSVDSLSELGLRRIARRTFAAYGHEMWRASLRTPAWGAR